MQYQILQTYIIRIVWQIARKITREILGVKGINLIDSVRSFLFRLQINTS